MLHAIYCAAVVIFKAGSPYRVAFLRAAQHFVREQILLICMHTETGFSQDIGRIGAFRNPYLVTAE